MRGYFHVALILHQRSSPNLWSPFCNLSKRVPTDGRLYGPDCHATSESFSWRRMNTYPSHPPTLPLRMPKECEGNRIDTNRPPHKAGVVHHWLSLGVSSNWPTQNRRPGDLGPIPTSAAPFRGSPRSKRDGVALVYGARKRHGGRLLPTHGSQCAFA